MAEKGLEERAALRRPESLRCRLEGFSYRQIGLELGISHTQAIDDVRRILRETLALSEDEVAEFRELENQRYDMLWEKFFPMAINNLDEKAALRCLQISKARRELNGLDAPVKIAIEGELGLHPIQKEMEELTEKQLIALAGDKGIVVPMKLVDGKRRKVK